MAITCFKLYNQAFYLYNLFENLFVKPKGQNDVCIRYALARKGRKDFNVFSSVCIRVIRVQNLFPLISYFSLRARTVFLCFSFIDFWHAMPRMRQAMNDGNKFTAGIDGSMRKAPTEPNRWKGFFGFFLRFLNKIFSDFRLSIRDAKNSVISVISVWNLIIWLHDYFFDHG